MNTAESHVLDDNEFLSMQFSLANILWVLDGRMDDIVGMFVFSSVMLLATSSCCHPRRVPTDSPESKRTIGHLRSWHCMYKLFSVLHKMAQLEWQLRLLYNTVNEWDRAANSLGNWFCEDSTLLEEVEEAVNDHLRQDLKMILRFPTKDTFETNIFKSSIPWKDHADIQNDVSGSWAGYLYEDVSKDLQGLTTLTLDVDKDGNITGRGENYTGHFQLSGSVSPKNEMRIKVRYEQDSLVYLPEPVTCDACFLPEKQHITGRLYVGAGGTQVLKSQGDSMSSVMFTRTPACLQELRPTQEQLQRNPAQTRWHFACNAILRVNRKSSWSWKYFKHILRRNQRFLELTVRLHEDKSNISPYTPLLKEEWYELQTLRRSIAPAEARFLIIQAVDNYRRITIHEYGETPYLLKIDSLNFHTGMIVTPATVLLPATGLFAFIALTTNSITLSTFVRCAQVRSLYSISSAIHWSKSGKLYMMPSWHGSYPMQRILVFASKRFSATTLRAQQRCSIVVAARETFFCRVGCVWNVVSHLFWCCGFAVCLYSDQVQDTFICDACERQGNFPLAGEHEATHALVRINNNDEVKEELDTNTRLTQLEEKLTSFDERFSALESSVEKIMSMLSKQIK
jgi:hypothetical protein